MKSHFVISGINPEPWTAPQVSIGRKGGRVFPRFYASEALKSYKKAIAEEIQAQLPLDYNPHDSELALTFFFWRHLVPYETPQARTARKHEADATNLQKALEDALQGVLFTNDRNVKHIQSFIMEQGHETSSLIIIEMTDKIVVPEWVNDHLDTTEPEQTDRNLIDIDPREYF